MVDRPNQRPPIVRLKEDFCNLVHPSPSLHASFVSSEFSTILWWNIGLDFPTTSVLRAIGKRIAAIPAGAADLERIWSSTLLLLSSKRTKPNREKFLKCVQFKTAITPRREKVEKMKDRKRKEAENERSAIRDSLRDFTGTNFDNSFTETSRDEELQEKFIEMIDNFITSNDSVLEKENHSRW